MMPPSTHGALSPSKLSRILACPGSLALAAKYEGTEEDEQNVYAAEGSLLHFAVEQALRKAVADGYRIKPIVTSMIVNPPLDDEQVSAVQDCVDYTFQLLRTLNEDFIIHIEKEVTLARYSQALFECFGTADLVIETATKLYVIDWKFGQGILVFATENDQLYAYLVGAAINEDIFAGYSEFIVHVVQPRLDHFDRHVITPESLRAWLNGRLLPGVLRAYEKHAPFNPGPNQCRWCPAKNKCRARYNKVQQTAADIFKVAAGMPDDVTLKEIAEALLKAPQYEQFISDMRQYIQRKLEQGQEVPHWKLVAGRSNRKWASDQAAEEWLLEHYDYDQVYKTQLISAPQAERLSKSLKTDEEFQALIEKPQGKPTLVPATDPRLALDFRKAEEKFKDALVDEEDLG